MNRIIDVFPTNQQDQVRAQLALVLEGVLCQQLIPTSDGRGRAMAMEIMVATPAIRNLIREEKIHQIYSAMQAGQKFGMQTMNQSLLHLIQRGKISRDDALNRTMDPQELLHLLGGLTPGNYSATIGATAHGGSPFAQTLTERDGMTRMTRRRLRWPFSRIRAAARPESRGARSRPRTA